MAFHLGRLNPLRGTQSTQVRIGNTTSNPKNKKSPGIYSGAVQFSWIRGGVDPPFETLFRLRASSNQLFQQSQTGFRKCAAQ